MKKKPKPKPAASPIRDRIKELRRVSADKLRPNPRNWRTHPQAQRDALRGVLAEVGYAGALLARELPDGSLELIDGHLRAETTPEMEVPVLILDLDQDEVNKLLTVLDPLAAMAKTNEAALDSLLREVTTKNDAVRAMLDKMDAQEPTVNVSEQSEKLRKFIEAREKARANGQYINDCDFWVCLTFQTRAQKLEFLAQLPGVPVLYGMYADGEAFAAAIEKPITADTHKPARVLVDKQLAELVVTS